MPALLPVLEDDKVCEHRVSCYSPVAALALDFPLGGPRLGMYCSLTCFLVSHNNQSPCPWEIEMLPDSNTLYRNCIRFCLPGFPGSVTLIDTFTHFEINVITAKKVCQKVCSHVRHAIATGLKKAGLMLGYSDSTPSLTALCPCSAGVAHMATVGDGLWTCKRNKNKFGDLEENFLVWQDPGTTSRGNGRSSYKITSLDCTPTLGELISFPTPQGQVNLAEQIGGKY